MMKCGFLICAVAGVLLLSSYAWGMGERPKSGSTHCITKGAYLKMGETLLYVPPELSSGSAVRYNREAPKNVSCYKKGAAPIEVTGLSVFPRKHFSDFSIEGKRDEIGRALAFWLRAGLHETIYKDDFERLKEQYKIDLESLPTESEFYVFQGDKVYQKFFISNPALLKTAKGNPVVFTCHEPSTEYCEVLLTRGNVVFGISQINRFHVPMQDWPKFYRQFESLVDRLIIESETEILQLQAQGEKK